MAKLVRIALAVLVLSGIASAQNIPAIDVFGGYSFLNFNEPGSTQTYSVQTFKERLPLQGWDFSASVGRFHHFAGEVDISGHHTGNCGGSGVTCSDLSYLFGPRYTMGKRSNKITGFAHLLIGRDQADLLGEGDTTVSDTSLAIAAGGGADYWFSRYVGIQFGPVDYIFTNHLNNYGAASQNSFRASAGIAFRFGGDFPPQEPRPQREPKSVSSSSSRHRLWRRSKSESGENRSSTVAKSAAHPTQPLTSAPSRGMSVSPLGIVAAPQEFDGAKILEIVPGSVAEMAALHVGDLIKSVDGKAVRTPMELAAELSDKSGKVRIGILRGDVAIETVILLGAH